MVSFTFCSTLAHIVRRYELGDRRALNILNWPTKAHDEDFDEAENLHHELLDDFNDDVLKDIAQVCFSVSHLCLSYLLVFVLVLVVVVVPFPGRD